MGLGDLALAAGVDADLRALAPDHRRIRPALVGVAGRVGAAGTEVKAGQVAWLDPSGADEAADALAIEASTPFRAALFSGRPIDEPVAAYGPFVMNTADEIRQAVSDYRNGALV